MRMEARIVKALIDRIKAEGTYIGGGIIKVDSFVNHQIDPTLTMAIGSEFANRFAQAGVDAVTKVVTAEVSGIAPALATAQALGVPMVYARKHRPITMPDDFYLAEAPSHTKGGVVRLMISPEYLAEGDRVLLIDDFLATGLTISAVVELIRQSRATLCGIGCVIEKVFEGGRTYLADLDVPIIALAKIDLNGDSFTVL
jgi:xanthine phosphoribosyltransferase